tara:strand:+ start:132650 stop:133003 length:354 start_codon:yes stop_codon:yes gene_type:complete
MNSAASLERALDNQEPLLPKSILLSEEQFVQQYLSLDENEQAVFLQDFMDQHKPFRKLAREIRAQAEEAHSQGNHEEAERLRELLIRWGNELQTEQYSLLTQAYGQAISEYGERKFD